MMNTYYSLDNIEFNSNTVITIGTFDGVHAGHKKLLEIVANEKNEKNYRSFLITFEPHPRVVVSKDYKVQLLTSLKEKLQLFEQSGIDNVLVIKFDEQFSQTDYTDFIQNIILKKIGAKHIIIGYDHKFGKDRSGDEIKLRQLGDENNFKVTTVSPVLINNEIVSSTKIRNAISNGNINLANKFLGRNYEFTGEIVNGEKRGRTLGFPTANLQINDQLKIIPQKGVYAVKGIINENNFNGIMNIGVRPTFENNGELKIEIHLFDFGNFVYGELLTVNFIEKIRDEKKFNNANELVNQINIDVLKAKEILNIK